MFKSEDQFILLSSCESIVGLNWAKLADEWLFFLPWASLFSLLVFFFADFKIIALELRNFIYCLLLFIAYWPTKILINDIGMSR
jgi:hypothetical protein